MAQIYDISMKINSELPLLKITDTLTVTVNNKKSTILNLMAMYQQEEKKKNQSQEAELKVMNKALGMLIGDSNAKIIDEMDLPIPSYKKVYETIINIATGEIENTPI